MREIVKRCFDAFFSFFGLVLLSPLLLIVALLIKLEDNGSIFFIQERVGRNFKPLRLYKFRTMVADAPKKGLPMTAANDPRITAIGRFLRKTKLDELPQLVNVLKGDMSIVGPRPEVARFVERFKDDYREILSVRPGLTDYAAIEFRNEEDVLKKYSDPEEGYVKEVLPAKIALYKQYLKNESFTTDVYLIWKTIYAIVKK